MEIIYTESGKQEMEKFQEEQKKLLEDLICKKKVVFGDETVEITAKDIRDESKNIQLEDKTFITDEMISFASKIYFLLGTILIVYALNYNYFEKILHQNPKQALYLSVGVAAFLCGFFLNSFGQMKSMNRIAQRIFEVFFPFPFPFSVLFSSAKRKPKSK